MISQIKPSRFIRNSFDDKSDSSSRDNRELLTNFNKVAGNHTPYSLVVLAFLVAQ